MVNIVNDPRYQMARLMREQSSSAPPVALNPARSKASIELGRSAVKLATANPTLREQLDAISKGAPAVENKNVIESVLTSTPGKFVLNGLNALAMPGRAIVYTAREIADAGDGLDETRFSFGDFTKKVSDPTYGFGTAFNPNTGNKWLDRGIGFAGDVLLDPLTYATFGGGKFAGYAGRLDLAQAVLKTTGDARLANRVQRYGRAAIKDKSILDRVGANRHGIYLLGKRTGLGRAQQGIRIPGTGAIGYATDNLFTRIRLGGGKAKRYLEKLVTPEDAFNARIALRNGELGDDAAAAVIAHLTADAPARMAQGTTLAQENVNLISRFQAQEALGLEGYAKDIYKYLENPEMLRDAPANIQSAAEYWRAFFTEKEDAVSALLRDVDPLTEFTGRQNYFPMIHSDDARALMNDPSNPHYANLREIYTRDPLEGGGNFKTRTLREGDTWFGHTLTKNDIEGGIQKLNEIARRPGTGFTGEFFETDIRKVLPKYIEEFSKEIGVLTRHKHLVDNGFWKRADNVMLGENVVDREAVSVLKSQVKSVQQELRDAVRQVGKANADLIDAITAKAKQAQKAYDDFNAKGGALGASEELAGLGKTIDDALNNSILLTSDTIDSLGKAIGVSKAKLVEIFGGQIVNGKVVYDALDGGDGYVIDGLLSHMDTLEQDMFRLRTELFTLDQDLTGAQLKYLAEKAQKELALAMQRVKDYETTLNMTLEFGNQLNSAVAKSIAGDGTGDVLRDVSDILTLTGMDDLQAASIVEGAIMRSTGASGDMYKTFAEYTNRPNGLWQRATRSSKLTKERVTKKTLKDFFDDIPRLVSRETSMDETREMAMFILFRDQRIYNGRIPKSILRMREELIDKLMMADSAAAFGKEAAADLASPGKKTSRRIFETSWNDMITQVLHMEDQMKSIDSFLERVGTTQGAGQSSVMLDDIVDWDTLDYSEYPFLFDFAPENMGNNFAAFRTSMEDPGSVRYVDSVSGAEDLNTPVNRGALESEEITYRQLVERINNTRKRLQQKMDDDEYGFELYNGVARRKYSGKQVIAKHREYYALLRRRNEILDMRAAKRDTLLKERAKIEADVVSLRNRKKQASLLPAGQRAKYWVPEMEARLKQSEAILRKPIKMEGVENEFSFAQLGPAIEREYAEVTAKIKEIADSNSLTGSEFAGTVKQVQEELSNAVVQYTIVSEVVARWNSVSEIMSAYGVTPSQSVFGDITKSVGQKFIPHLEAQRFNLTRSRMALQKLDAVIAERITTSNGSGKTVGQMFAEEVNKLSKEERELISSIVGPSFAGGADPREMVRGLTAATSKKTGSARTAAENEYVARVIKPWFDSAFPERAAGGKKAGKGEMIRTLRNMVSSTSNTLKRANQTPWASDADITVVRNWFEQHLPSSVIPGSKKYRTAIQGDLYAVVGSGHGVFKTKYDTLTSTIHNIEQLLAPDLNVQKFLDNPLDPQKTPTLYAKMIEHRIDILDEMIGDRRAGRMVIAETEERARSAGQTAETMAAQAKALEGRKAGKITTEDVSPNVVKRYKETKPKVDAYLKLSGAVDSAKTKVDEIREQIKPFASKKRTKTGLTTAEEKKLGSLYAQQRKAKKALDDANKALAGVKKPTAQEIEFGSIPEDKFLSRARKVLDEYNRKTSSVNYSRALDDQEMIRVLDALAGYDLSVFRFGFQGTDGKFATFADGKRIVFSKEEWESLYVDRIAGDTVESINAQLTKNNSEILRLSKLRNEWGKKVEQAANAPMELNVERAQFALDNIENQLRQARELRDELTNRRVVVDPETQRAALEKLRILVHDTVEGPSVLGGANLKKFLNYEHPTLETLLTSSRAQLFTGDDVWQKLSRAAHDAEIRYYDIKAENRRIRLEDQGSTYRQIKESDALLEQATAEYNLTRSELARFEASKREQLTAGKKVVAPSDDVVKTKTAKRAKEVKAAAEPIVKSNIKPKDLAARQKVVANNWQSSDEFKFLQEVSEMEKNIFVSIHRYNKQGVEGMIRERDRLLSILENERAAYALAHPLEDIQAMVGANGTIANLVREADTALMDNTGRFVAAEGDKAVEAIDTAGKQIEKLTADRAKLVEANRGTKYKTGTQQKIDAIDKRITELQDEITTLGAEVKKRMDVAPPATREDVRAYVEEIRRLANERGPLFQDIPGVRGRKIEEAAGNLVNAVEDAGRRKTLLDSFKAESEQWGKTVAQQRQSVLRVASEKAQRLETAEGILKALRSKEESVLAEMIVTLGLPTRMGEVVPDFVREQFWKYLDDQRALGAALKQQLDEANALVDLLPEQEVISALRKVSGGRASKEVTQEALRRFKIWQRENRAVFEGLASNPDDPVYKAWAAAGLAESQFIMNNVRYHNKLGELVVKSQGEWKERVVAPLAEEWEDAARRTGLISASERTGAQEGLYGLVGNREALDLISNVARIRQPGVVDDLSRFMRGYTGFFRAYATLSPGFHIRNSISNVFSMFAAGADVKNMYDGFRLWRMLDREMARGGSIESFLASVPAAEKEFAKAAAGIMYGLNSGKVSDALAGFARQEGNVLQDNFLIRGSHLAGNKAEGSARFMLAYDSLVKGYETGHAFNRTRRYLIDYQQKTVLDNMMRDIIPFWTWMSRNLPLQVVNRWANPKPYLIYMKLQNNLSEEETVDNPTPLYLKQMGALGLGGGKFLNVDLPFSRTDEQIAQLGSPREMLSYLNPGIKTPLELLTNTNTFTGKPFKDEYVPVGGAFQAFIPILKATGELQYDSEGNPVMSRKAMSALTNLIPPLGRAERLFPTTEGGTSPGNAFNSFIGLPITNVGPEKQDAERFRRIAAMQELVNQRKKIEEAR